MLDSSALTWLLICRHLCHRDALIHTAEPLSHTTAAIQLTPPAANVVVQK